LPSLARDSPLLCQRPRKTDRYRLGVEQVIVAFQTLRRGAGDEPLPNLCGALVQARQALLIRGQMRKGFGVIGTDEQVSGFEDWGLKITLHQGKLANSQRSTAPKML
jgi:hypothetical protein